MSDRFGNVLAILCLAAFYVTLTAVVRLAQLTFKGVLWMKRFFAAAVVCAALAILPFCFDTGAGASPVPAETTPFVADVKTVPRADLEVALPEELPSPVEEVFVAFADPLPVGQPRVDPGKAWTETEIRGMIRSEIADAMGPALKQLVKDAVKEALAGQAPVATPGVTYSYSAGACATPGAAVYYSSAGACAADASSAGACASTASAGACASGAAGASAGTKTYGPFRRALRAFRGL
jgi:hypothetical protein